MTGEIAWPASSVEADERPVDGDVPNLRHVLPGREVRELAACIQHVLSDQQAAGADVARQAVFVAHYLAPRLAEQAADLADARLQVEQAGAELGRQVEAARLWSDVATGRHMAAQRLREELQAALGDAERFRALVGGVCPQGVHAGWSVEPGHVYVCPCLLDGLAPDVEDDRSDVDGAS